MRLEELHGLLVLIVQLDLELHRVGLEVNQATGDAVLR